MRRLVAVSVVGAQEIAEVRRHHLAALAYEAEARGLRWRLAGPEESVLGVANATTRRQVMVVATPSGEGWSYLWSGGGIADVADVARVADRLLQLLA
ncbi:hypothetical protein J4573_01900 [Actinomadura barringtoniae]|uniref:Uncharacterized protein n=1 Tax=Actinomadura barringtoniae TaxID=1427535 RepID=A0A939P9I6_9ACTN|nr:hypothetical protein [Actinomadura barringtoniae]MBO2445833.1 hypothetical protein [Actinomadura barringtoniae]